MTTENIIKRLSILEALNRNSRDFRDLAEKLEKIIEAISPNEFERKDALMKRLTQICCSN